MSRFRKYAHSLLSGYVLLGANVLFTLASVPLALAYLSKAEFGLWALTTTIGGYILLIDFGMGGSVARILIDHKDDRAKGDYGSVIQTGVLVGVTQGLLILVVGTLLAFVLGPALEVPEELRASFRWLMIGQCAMLAMSFSARIFTYLLNAHQRYDITNYAQALLFAVSYAIQWCCFAGGLGVFSILWAQAFGTAAAVAVNGVGCARLKLFPARGEWGRPTWARFHELFAFGRDIFLYSLGGQLISASQTLLLTRFIGLDAAAVWNICTRTFNLLLQAIYRIFDYSSPALAEMMVRGERQRLSDRFKEIVVLSASLSVVAATLFALCNSPFVAVWTSGKMGRPSTVSADTITNLAAFATRLKEASDADPVSQYLAAQLSSETLARLQQYASGPDAKLRGALAEDLAEILQAGSLYDARRFAGTTLSPETRQLLAQNPRGEELVPLNRMLLLDAYPTALARGQAGWSPLNDWLLAVWLMVCVSLHTHTGLVGQTKRLRFQRYIFFFEGLTFVGLTILLHRFGGITMMLVASVVCSLAFSFPYGLWRTHDYFGLRWSELAGWHRAPLALALWLAPVAVATGWLTRDWPPLLKLAVCGGAVGLWAGWVLLRHGLDAPLQAQLLHRAPGWLRPALVRAGCSGEARHG